MRLDCIYAFPPKQAIQLIDRLHTQLLSKLPSSLVTTEVVIDIFYSSNADILSIQRVYGINQLQNDKISGAPLYFRLVRKTLESTTIQELTHANMVDLSRTLEFINYKKLGSLTQIRTMFSLKGPLIELPLVLNETREFGAFLEIGTVSGPINEIQALLGQLQSIINLPDSAILTVSYSTLIERISRARVKE